MLWVGMIQAAVAAGIGLFAGVAAGVGGLLFVQNQADFVALVANVLWALVILTPVGVWLGHDIRPYGPYKERGVDVYVSLPAALLTSGLSSLAGSFLGARILFPFGPTMMLTVLGGAQVGEVRAALGAALAGSQLWLILASGLLTGLVLAILGHRRMAEEAGD
jgi:hypothetical protein